MKFILDIGAGKYNTELVNRDPDNGLVIVHIDRCYGSFGKSVNETACVVQGLMNASDGQTTIFWDNIMVEVPQKNKILDIFCKSDVWEFMDGFPIKIFDRIICNRMFEHLEYCGGEVGRMIEACNAISKYDATLEFVVPNAEKLARMILKQGVLSDNEVMIINTEFCNGKFDPHASVWTPKLAKKYIEQEGTWNIIKIDEDYPFAGRDIYMKVWCKKPAELQHDISKDK